MKTKKIISKPKLNNSLKVNMPVAFLNCIFHPSKKDDSVTPDPFTFNEHIKNLLEFARFGESGHK